MLRFGTVQRDWCALVVLNTQQRCTAAALLFRILSPACARLFVVASFTWHAIVSVVLFAILFICLFHSLMCNGKGCSVFLKWNVIVVLSYAGCCKSFVTEIFCEPLAKMGQKYSQIEFCKGSALVHYAIPYYGCAILCVAHWIIDIGVYTVACL